MLALKQAFLVITARYQDDKKERIMGYDISEKRRSCRAAFRCKIIVNAFGKEFISHTENTSKGGIKVLLEEGLQHEANVGLKLYVVRYSPIECEGRIVWVKEIVDPIEGRPLMYNTGIMFTSINESDRDYINDLVDCLLSSKENRSS